MNYIRYRSPTEASNQPRAMYQLPLPTAPALLPAPFPCPLAHWVCHKQAQDVSHFAPGAAALDVLFLAY